MNRILGILLLLMSSSTFAIRGGVNAYHPHLAKLSIGDQTCSGIRVHKDYVLTAAHCFKGSRSSFTLRYTDGNIRIKAKVWKSSLIFKGTNLSEELVLVPLFSQNENFMAPLIYQGNLFGNFKIYGYGMNESGNLSHLRSGVVTSKYTTDREGFKMLVIKPGPSNQNPCPGDSGGPIFKEVDGVEQLVGIVSFINHTDITFGAQNNRRGNRNSTHDPKLEACKKANQAYYVLLTEHLDFLATHLGQLNLAAPPLQKTVEMPAEKPAEISSPQTELEIELEPEVVEQLK